MVSGGFRWSQVVSDGLRWSQMISDGLRWYQMVSDFLGWSILLILITIEWFKTPKPISGLDRIGWIWMVSGGRRYRAPYGANNCVFYQLDGCLINLFGKYFFNRGKE